MNLRNSLLDVIWPLFKIDFSAHFNQFFDILHSSFRSSVPIEYDNIDSSSSLWSTRELRGLRNRTNMLYKRFKGSGSCADYMNYSIVMHKCDALNRKCNADYLVKVKARLNSDPKFFLSVC